MEIVRKQKNIFSTFGELKEGDTFIARLYNSDTETTEDYCVCVKIWFRKERKYVAANLTFNKIAFFDDTDKVEIVKMKVIEV